MNKLFGKKKTDSNKPDDALKKLKDIQDIMNKKQSFLEKKIEVEVETAKKHGIKNKKAALQALGRKKRLEKQLQQIDGTLTTIDFQIEALENASTNTEVLKAMKSATQALKVSHQNIDVDKVNDIMDDMQEQNELAKEIAEAISNPVGFGNDIDEDELLAELELLQEEELKQKLITVESPQDVKFPSVPTQLPADSKPKAGKTKEDDDLDELKNWAS